MWLRVWEDRIFDVDFRGVVAGKEREMLIGLVFIRKREDPLISV